MSCNVNKIECNNDIQVNGDVADILQRFYLQLHIQPISFTAFGFYKINLTLFASVITGTVSYQILLVQFHQSSGTLNIDNTTHV